MINIKNNKNKKVINKVVWVWSVFFRNNDFTDTPPELQKYFNQGYTIKDFSVTTYNTGTKPVYMFILEKTLD